MPRGKLLPPQKPRKNPPTTPALSGIRDNRANGKVGEFLREKITPDAEVRVVSAYFSIYAHQALCEELKNAGTFRFLFGDPRSVGSVIPGENKAKQFLIHEDGELGPAPSKDTPSVLAQKYAAEQCAEWVKRDNVHIKTMRDEFLHGKMFHMLPPEDLAAAICGSSNFTARGLGFGRGNRELNIVADTETADDLLRWFNNLWHSRTLLRDASNEVLDALKQLGKNQDPEFIYFLTLYRLFCNELEKDRQSAADSRLEESDIWNTLHPFQRHAVYSVIKRLRQHNICILADSVGLGKTYTALAVIKHFWSERILVLCPKRLMENWEQFLHDAPGHNPLRGDHFRYRVCAHTDLSSPNPKVDWNSYDLVVIDESHNFRNHAGARYKTLQAALQKSRAKTLMLSATPVNISLKDIRNQILLTAEDGAFSRELGITSVRGALDASQQAFAIWENSPNRDKDKLMESMSGAFLKLMNALTIARSRRHVQTYYAAAADGILDFPKHAPVENSTPGTDIGNQRNPDGKLSYDTIHDKIGELSLALYSPSEYLRDDSKILQELEAEEERFNFNQKHREHFLIGMMRVNLLKRLESSVVSFRHTLTRTIDKIREVEGKIDRFLQKPSENNIEVDAQDILAEDSEDEEFSVGHRRRYDLAELNLDKWRAELKSDREKLENMLKNAECVTIDRDAKLAKLKRILREKMENPPKDKDGKENRKALVFTTFADTADYLYDSLRPLARELGLHIGLVKGSGANLTTAAQALFGKDATAKYGKILDHFSPRARQLATLNGAEIDLLIATDCISEGQNLQDCDWVVNYDIHWNPVRIVQRFGRIDRIGGRNKEIRMTNFWPHSDLDEYLALRHRVNARMALIDITGAGGMDAAKKQAEEELNFRDAQLRKMIEEGKTLTSDDLGNVSPCDFTMVDFLAELRAFLESRKEELKNAPDGLFAVAKSNPDIGAHPGIIFCLKQANAENEGDADDRIRQSPTYPYFLVYVLEDENGPKIRFGFPQSKRILTFFGNLCRGETAPLSELCKAFDNEIDNGENMESPNAALQSAVDDIVRKFTELTGRTVGPDGDGMLPQEGQIPQAADDFELISWLVIRDHPL